MTTKPWQAVLARWGDSLWRLALLLAADPATAQVTLVRAVTHACTTPSADPEATLVQALLRQRPRWQHPFRRRLLPRPLARIAPTDRVLLALWLLHDLNGPRLVTISGLPQDALVTHLATALTPLLPRHDPAHTPAGRAALVVWIAQQLGFSPPATSSTTNNWQAAIDSLRTLLHTAIGQQHMPPSAQAAIEAALNNPAEATPARWWQQQAVQRGGLVAGLLLLLFMVIAPWDSAPAPAPASALPSAQALVQQTLAAWSRLPSSGTLHRRVWAVDGRLASMPAVVTELWLEAESPRHRIEVRHDERLVEWQLADGTSRLRYTTDPHYSACPWQDSSLLDRLTHVYSVTPAQQRAVRDARLTLGAYGEGYHFLQAALVAPDLRSLGTQRDGATPVVLLSYTDRRLPAPRHLLLSIDPRAKQLQAVREVLRGSVQTAVRDLWRVEVDEVRPAGISLATPRWPRLTRQRDPLLDPSCPGLSLERVVSLRTIIRDGRWYLPKQLPPGTMRAVLLSSSVAHRKTSNRSAARAIFIGPDRWLKLSTPPQNYYSPENVADDIHRGRWSVQFTEEEYWVQARLCPYIADLDEKFATHVFCRPTFYLTARGWTHDELLEIIDTLAPVDAHTWAALDEVFLDPQPLPSQVRSIFARAFTAIEPWKEGTLYTAFEQHRRVNSDRPARQDPYYVSLEIVDPERFEQQQWLVYSDAQVVRFKQLRTTPDGALISAEASDGAQYTEYSGADGKRWTHHESQPAWWFADQQMPAYEMIMSFFGNPLPITFTQQRDGWLLEQPLGQVSNAERLPDRLPLVGPPPGIDSLPLGTFVQRISIDHASALPRWATVVHIDKQGRETEVGKLLLTEWRYLEVTLPPNFFTLPPLPSDTLHLKYTSTWVPIIADSAPNLQPPARTLIWPTSSGIEKELERDFDATIFTAPDSDARLAQVASLYDFDSTGLLKVTHYRMPDGTLVILRQGARTLLRHKLRYQTRSGPTREDGWTSSRAIEVKIAGQRHTAWLLEGSLPTSLIVEVDDVLLYVTSRDAAYVKGPLLDELPKLAWEDVESKNQNRSP